MKNILVVNAKGGSGKTTLATNLASFYACWGIKVALVDYDPLASSLSWLAVRPANRPEIIGISALKGEPVIADNIDYVITDVPSGVSIDTVAKLLEKAERIIVPVLPSPLDIRSAGKFFYELGKHGIDVDGVHQQLAIVANRVKEKTIIYKTLQESLRHVKYPVVSHLKDSQNYIRAAEQGVGIFEMAPSRVKQDLPNWHKIITWLSANDSLPMVTPMTPQNEELSMA